MTSDDSSDDPRILDLARRYLAELEAGRTPDRKSYLSQFPELAVELEECLDGVELAHAMGVGLAPRPQSAGVADMNEPLGDFRILREIGRGGMGVVYEATQLSLGRRVALKVLPFAAGMDARQLQRFRTEAHAAAQLHHTSIVPVYAVGCERGTHFYAMQIIDGRGLDQVIRERRGDAVATGQSTQAYLKTAPADLAQVTRINSSRGGQNREEYRTAARLISQVADALEYAHEAGVVHRDIKPANLLLDAKGNLWVTDFGLAQVAAEAGGGPTRTGDIFGTLRYMSPEQASGRRLQIDHRTDIYSLGATFYELLTLQPLFPDTDHQALLHRIFHDDPTPPRQIDRGIPVELETILLKTLAKAPEDRYATAGELAADLRRFLDERPILARRPSFADRVRKWLRRHPSAVATAVVLLAFGLVAMAISTALVVREQQRTSEAYDRELLRASEAEERFELARRSADEMIRIADEDLSDNPAQQLLRRRLLETALAFYRELVDLRGENADAQAELAATRNRVQSILEDLAVMRGAWRHLLLRNPGVQDDLQLAQPQRVAIRDVLREIPNDGGPKGEAMRGHPFEQLVRDVRTHEAMIRGVLTVAQSHRLDQIGLQVRGAQAFREPEVIAALELSRAQREKIRRFEGPGFFDDGPPRRGPNPGPGPGGGGPGGGGPGGPGGGGFGGPGGGSFRDERQAMASILELLTEAQRATWKELVGPAYRGDMRDFRGGPGGRKK